MDNPVKPAECTDCSLNQVHNIIVLSYIRLNEYSFSCKSLELFQRFFGIPHGTVGNDNMRPFTSKAYCGCASNSSSAAGYNEYSVLESHPISLLCYGTRMILL